MKRFAHMLMGLAVIMMAASCGNETTIAEDTDFVISNPTQVRAGALVETGNESTLQFEFNGESIIINSDDIVATAQQMNAEDADAQAIMNINASLMGAEKEAQVLDVNFTMSDEPVENGMFIFGIETEDSKELTLEMYDEEGFSMVANNKFGINEGNNYKALNVKDLESGTYNFRLKDDAGRELNREVTVATK